MFFFSCEAEKHIDEPHCGGIVVSLDEDTAGEWYVRGSFNHWDLSTPMTYRGGRWEREVFLAPGDYAYAFYERRSGLWRSDPHNPLARYENGRRYSRLVVPDCRYPRLELVEPPIPGGASFTVHARFVPGTGGAGPDPEKSVVTVAGNIVTPLYDGEKRLFTITAENLATGKHTVVFSVRDTDGFAAAPLFVPIWLESSLFDWRDAVIYQVMTDRFVNGDLNNDGPVEVAPVKSNWQGGDFRGIIRKIEDGYFSELGVTALWISSPLANTPGAWKGMGNDPRLYTAYHSYWPIATGWSDLTPIPDLDSPVEPHFGTEAELSELIAKAHEQGIRVLFDIVPNHVHAESWLWRTYRYDGWFNSAPTGLPTNELGGYTCGWQQPEICWFTDYLPDIDHRHPAAMDMLVTHYLWLVHRFNVDGFRIDAVRLMNLDFVKTLRYFVERDTAGGTVPFFMVGETFTGDYGWNEIGFYLGPDKLDSQFDFPLFHHVARSFLTKTEGLDEFAAFLEEHDGRYQRDYHAGAVMATFLGNHDLCRALSSANGDFDGTSQGGARAHERVWTNEPETPQVPEPYERLRLAWVFLFTSPGFPTIYQGDEFGMPGANDPDNRRMMIFGDDLNEYQKETLSLVKKLAAIRHAHPAFRRGERDVLHREKEALAYIMNEGTETMFIVINRGDAPLVRLLEVPFSNQESDDVLTGKKVTVKDGSVMLSLPARSAAIYEIMK